MVTPYAARKLYIFEQEAKGGQEVEPIKPQSPLLSDSLLPTSFPLLKVLKPSKIVLPSWDHVLEPPTTRENEKTSSFSDVQGQR